MLKTWLLAEVLLALIFASGLPPSVRAQVCDPANPPLCTTEVQAIIDRATTVLDMPMVVAVVDRVGNVLGAFRKTGAPEQVFGNFAREALLNNANNNAKRDAVEVAVSLARTAAFFSNNQAPLSSRTVRFISGVHFPPGVMFTPNAALYGIENTNRGCDFNAKFNDGKEVPRAKAVNTLLPCTSMERGGCSLGITTGKIDFLDSDSTAVNPGGIPLFKGNAIVGGVGVVGDFPGDVAELVALVAAFLPTGTSVLPVPAFFTKDLRERVFIDGIRLPFVNLDVPKVVKQLTKGQLPAGLKLDPAPTGDVVVIPHDGQCFDQAVNGGVCRAAPEGYLIGPLAGTRLAQQEVDHIVQNALATANRTRAVIRFPRGSRTKMMISVADVDGKLLAVYRMPDATIFSIDVSTAKSRNVVYFSSHDPNVKNDLPGVPEATSISNRTLSFGAQPFYPPGIDTSKEGPFFRSLYVPDSLTPCTQGSQAANLNQSGIVFFPGSLALYRNGEVIGGLGISGDGVEQDDYVTVGGAVGFDPPDTIRADQVFVRSVRLGYIKFPRNPEK